MNSISMKWLLYTNVLSELQDIISFMNLENNLFLSIKIYSFWEVPARVMNTFVLHTHYLETTDFSKLFCKMFIILSNSEDLELCY